MVGLLPRSFLKYNLSSPNWFAAARRRMRLYVFPSQKHCTFCKGGWCDVKGDHAAMCGGGTSRVLRHNNTRNIIAKAARDVGFRTDLEHGGGLGDQRRPGDIIVYNWRDGRHLLIDVAVINPLCSTNIDHLISEGVGGAATAYCKKKERTYQDLDLNKYEFLPFIMESTGGLSKTAYDFCKQIKNLRESANCQSSIDCPYTNDRNPLQSALSIELQRANSRMILERTPVLDDLIDSDMLKCELSVSKKKDDAIETLWLQSLKPERIHEEIKLGQRSQIHTDRAYMRRQTIQQTSQAEDKPLKKKKRRRQTQREGINAYGRCADPSQPTPKPPEKGKDENFERREGPNMIGEKEERILTPKLNTSQDSSTSLVSDTSLLASAERSRKEVGPATMGQGATNQKIGGCRNRPHQLQADSAQVGKEGATKRVHWEPPCGEHLHQE